MKKFTTHSARWQREHLRAGWSPKLYDRYQKLAKSTRAKTPLDAYAKGISVPQFKAAETYDAAIRKMEMLTEDIDIARARVRQMTPEQIAWTSKATGQDIRNRAGNKRYEVTGSNVWWYKQAGSETRRAPNVSFMQTGRETRR